MDRGLRDQEHAAVAAREHEEVFEALEAHDPDRVRRVMGHHMGSASARLLSEFDQGSSEPSRKRARRALAITRPHT
ncbi:FCD domain-containing protein [Sinomonas gamaensis]|uniref:FCD domain-containing protein n=1 Tax=Sinomonas gamaensis TaxID=2565624 RepID=UPI0014866425